MLIIDKIGVEEDIAGAHFSCELSHCKEACCTFYGEFGAPVLDEEIPQIGDSFDAASEYLNQRSKDYIKEQGFVQGLPGDYTTVCINNKDCVFVFFENDIAKCALEKAYFDGKSDFRKPLSCHLFPIRVVKTENSEILYYEQIDECRPGVLKGQAYNFKLVETLKEALVRKFGQEWYNKLCDEIISGK